MADYEQIIELITRLQAELEGLCIRGLRAISTEQLNWLKASRDSLMAMGAEHLAGKITALLEQIEVDSDESSRRLLDLLTTVRVFERTATLREASVSLANLSEEVKA